jgi:hypothetical protein
MEPLHSGLREISLLLINKNPNFLIVLVLRTETFKLLIFKSSPVHSQ